MQLVKLTKFGVFGTFSLYEFMIKINGNLRTWPEKTENNCLTGPATMTFEEVKVTFNFHWLPNCFGTKKLCLHGMKYRKSINQFSSTLRVFDRSGWMYKHGDCCLCWFRWHCLPIFSVRVWILNARGKKILSVADKTLHGLYWHRRDYPCPFLAYFCESILLR